MVWYFGGTCLAVMPILETGAGGSGRHTGGEQQGAGSREPTLSGAAEQLCRGQVD